MINSKKEKVNVNHWKANYKQNLRTMAEKKETSLIIGMEIKYKSA